MEVKLSRIGREIKPSATMACSTKAKKMKAAGLDVVDFGLGEPDFVTPDAIREAGIAAINEGFTKYTPAAGIPELREAICEKLKRDNGLDYAPDQVVVSCGAKQSLFNVIMVLCDKGDDVLIPAPYWVTYPDQVVMAGARPVPVPASEEASFKLTADALLEAVTPASKVLILNSPCNPTGMAYSEDELREVVGAAVEKGLFVVSDEIYEKLVYDGHKHVSPASFGPEFKEKVITVNGFSKAYAMTGWRMGYAAGPIEIMKPCATIQSQVTSGPFSIAQKAALAALAADQGVVDEMVAEFDRRRKLIVERLNALPGIKCVTPNGAFYAFPNVSEWFGKTIEGRKVEGSADFADVLLEKAMVATVPGFAFGADDHIRLSYATSTENIEKGMDRLEKLLG